ncbi:DNA polymerase III subunit alpha [uncultured Desulfobacter sp.]|uniref:DNA polymerase III subunit alpha n=1 Tax=uncultured Desulfobacter sp. TaxID=240139 RepID=UPI0029F5C6CC|nr:DNA polymerase III subunit alpha [uncultured Desulfobacter sp.]
MIPLAVHSHYSLMWGVPGVRELCARAKALGYTALALTDTNNLYGLWPFLDACAEFDLRPLVGAEIIDPNTGSKVVALVKDSTGYANLCRLITQRHRDPDFNLAQAVSSFGQGLVLLTPSTQCLSYWHALFCQGMDLDIAAFIGRTPVSRNRPLCRAALAAKLPLVAAPDSYFLSPEDHDIHSLLRAIDTKTSLSQLSFEQMASADAFLGSPDYYAHKFAALPEALTSTHILADRIEFSGPDFGIVMPPYTPPLGQTCQGVLRKKTMAGAIKRYGPNLSGRVLKRIDHELTIIEQTRFSAYFLVVADIVKQASRTCGRGSGAASIVAYCLGITNVCPIKHNLYFERFLNRERRDPPDIDVDFAWDERDAILSHVLHRFKGQSAMVASHILFQPRMAVRETARVFGVPEAEIKRKISRLCRDTPFLRGIHALNAEHSGKTPRLADPWPRIVSLAGRLIETPRHLSVHPGGIVITPDPIDTYVPVEDAPKGIPVIQWEKESAEAAGLVKIDLLGNRSLGVIRDCISSIRETQGEFTDFQEIDPEDDPATQQQVAQGRTMGCFYIESPAMRLLQKKSGQGDFRHLVIHSSIIRPAANEFINAYLKRLHSGVWAPLHPLMEGLLSESFGIMVFQEDVSQAAVRLAGFTHARAEELRKVMSKKDRHKKLEVFRAEFFDGARRKGVSLDAVERIWHMILSFSGYSFCKPHSASYARVSFQAAYLKTHYPAQFMAAVISNQGGFYSTFAYVSEARRMGIAILGPDVRHSRVCWTGVKKEMRVGLMAVKTLGRTTMDQIVQEREKKMFLDCFDFFNRISPREDEARALTDSGCLDGLLPGTNRGGLTWAYYVWQTGQRSMADRRDLFGSDKHKIPNLPPDPPLKRLRREFAVLGFLPACHPLALIRERFEDLKVIKAVDLPGRIGRKVCFAGWLITGKLVRTRQGDPMKFLTFEDDTGLVETVLFPRIYTRFSYILDHGYPYLLSGRVENEWGAITLTVSQVSRL